MYALALARSNIALVKYWGKRDERQNLPAVGSISLTLSGLETRTHVRFDQSLSEDRLLIGGEAQTGSPLERAQVILDLIRVRAGLEHRATVESSNGFPTAAGLASSASGMAALTAAAARAAGLDLGKDELSSIARRGSGSAARSIHGGFVELDTEGKAQPLEPNGGWDVRMVVAITHPGAKANPSRTGMIETARTSPYYAAWVEGQTADLEAARSAIRGRDIAALGQVAERSCLKMHAAAMTANPPLLYFSPATLTVLDRVRALRTEGLTAYFTIDAGPQVKILCPTSEAPLIEQAVSAAPGVLRTMVCSPGAGVEILEAS